MKELRMFLLFSILLCGRCVPPQYRLDFDLTRNALVSCDDRIKIKRITIDEKDGGSRIIINLDLASKGRNIIYLDKENEGYYCNNEYPLKLKPNKEYTIVSMSLDSGLEMKAFTNNKGRIDSVFNPLGCIKGE